MLKESFKVLNPSVIPVMGDIDNAFFDKMGNLSTTEYDLKTIASKTKLYMSEK